METQGRGREKVERKFSYGKILSKKEKGNLLPIFTLQMNIKLKFELILPT